MIGLPNASLPGQQPTPARSPILRAARALPSDIGIIGSDSPRPSEEAHQEGWKREEVNEKRRDEREDEK